MLRVDQIRALVQEHGAAGYLQIQEALLQGRTLPNGRKLEPKKPEEFSFRALWEGLVGRVEETVPYAMASAGYVEIPQSIIEQVGTGVFPSAVGQLIASKVIDGYEGAPSIGDELVDPVRSTLKGERIVGFTALQGPKEVEEFAAYEESEFGEKYVTSTETKRGRLLSVSEEAVVHDQTGQVLRRASQLGRAARDERERRIIRGVADVTSTVRTYRPTGTAEQLYVAGNNNLLATATPLVDWTDINEVLQYHAANVRDDREPDDTMGTQPISLGGNLILLTGVELAGTAARIVSATETRHNNTISGNVATQLIPGLRALSSVHLDAAEGEDQFDDASDWFLGDFKQQFIYKTIWPLQTFRAPMQNDEMFKRDIVAQFKVREYGDLVCTDERFVIKINAV